jgi:hypothetical protein
MKKIMMRDRINCLNLVFGEIGRLIGKNSFELKQLFEYAVAEYNEYYCFVFDCLSYENKKTRRET